MIARYDSAISLRSVTKSFGAGGVQNLSLDIAAGSICGLLGPNGAGKTTTIRLLLGLIRSDSGAIRVHGIDPTANGDRVRAQCGAVLEWDGLYERLTVRENLELFGRLHSLSSSATAARVDQLLTLFDLSGRCNDLTGLLSTGLRKRAAIARALIHRPPVLFLDEPTAGLDPLAAGALRSQLQKLQQDSGTTVLLATHNLQEAERICNTVAIIRAGRIVKHGQLHDLGVSSGAARFSFEFTPLTAAAIRSIQQQPGVLAVHGSGVRVIVTVSAKEIAGEIVRLLVHLGCAVIDVRTATQSLEDVFLQFAQEPKA